MANDNNGPKLERTFGDYLTGAAIIAPIATGVGTSVYRAYQGLEQSPTSISQETIELAAAIQRQIPGIDTSQVENFLKNNWNELQNTPNIVDVAWQQAYKNTDPLSSRYLKQFHYKFQTLKPTERLPFLRHAMKGIQEPHTASVFFDFSRNLNVLLQQPSGFKQPFISPSSESAMEYLTQPKLSDISASLPKFIEGVSSRTGATFGTSVSVPRIFQGKLGFGGIDLSVKFGNQGFYAQASVPITSQGYTVKGKNLQAKYIAPDVALFNPKTGDYQRMSRTEYFFQELESGVFEDVRAGRISSQTEFQRAIKQTEYNIFGELENVVNLPSQMLTPGLAGMEALGSQKVQILSKQERAFEPGQPYSYSPAYSRATPDEMVAAMRKSAAMGEPLFGGTSPSQAAKGFVQGSNLGDYYLFPEAINYGRRPESLFKEYSLTSQSMEAVRRYHKRHGTKNFSVMASSRALEAGLEQTSPFMRTLYVDPKKYSEVLNLAGVNEGEGLIRSSFANLLEFETIKTKKLSKIRQDVMGKIAAGQAESILPGTVIGWDRGGKPLTLKENQQIIHSVNIPGKSSPYTQIAFRETRRVGTREKFFLGARTLARRSGDTEFELVLSEILGKSVSESEARQYQMIASIDELAKDKSKLYNQMLTEMSGIAEKRFTADPLTSNVAIRQLAVNPERTAQLIKKYATKKGRLSEGGMMAGMFAVAKELNLAPEEFKSVFGAAGQIIDKKTISQAARGANISTSLLDDLSQGFAAGMANYSYSGPSTLRGAGATGSIEPRFLDMFSEANWGAIGPKLKGELVNKLILTNPEKIEVSQALSKTLLSMRGELTPQEGETILRASSEDFLNNMFEQFKTGGSFWIDAGIKQNKIYVPGADVTDAMREMTINGEKILGSLAKPYRELGFSAQRLALDEITPEMYAKEVGLIQKELQKQWAPYGKGMGGFLRGKVAGSAFGTLASEAPMAQKFSLLEKEPGMQQAAVSQDLIDKMLREAEEAGVYSVAEISKMRSAFYAGKAVPTLGWRHPGIGAFSIQPFVTKMIPGNKESIIQIPEKVMSLTSEAGEALGSVRVSPLIGMFADRDDDFIAMSLVSPDAQAEVRRLAMDQNSEFLKNYTSHQIRYQLLKPGKVTTRDTMTIADLMYGDVKKLAESQQFIGSLSNQFTEAKRFLHSASTAEAGNALGLLEWMEQTVIGGKHLSAEEVLSGEFGSMIKSVESNLRAGNVSGLLQDVQTLAGTSDLSKRMLNEGIQLSEQSTRELSDVLGYNVSRNLSGLQVENAVNTITNVLNNYRGTPAAEMQMAITGRTSKGIHPNILRTVGQVASSGADGVMNKAVSTMLESSNKLLALGEGVIKNWKPIGFGFAGALAISAALADPGVSVGKGSQTIPPPKDLNYNKSAFNMTAEDIIPETHTVNSDLENPDLLRMQRAMVQNPQLARTSSIQATLPPNANINSISAAIAMANGNNSNTVIHLRDDRRKINEFLDGNKG